jgi:hypothetical protein
LAFSTWYSANAAAIASSGEAAFFTTWITGGGGGGGSLTISGISDGTKAVYVFNSGTNISSYAAITDAYTSMSYQAVGASLSSGDTFTLYGWSGSAQAGTFAGTGAFPVLLLNTSGSITDPDNPMYSWASVEFSNGSGTVNFSSFSAVIYGSIQFTNIDGLAAYLSARPANTAETPYTVSLDGVALSELASGGDTLGALFAALNGKYVALDLSGCTGASIGDNGYNDHPARSDVDKLVSLILPSGLETIGIGAFYYCTSLASVALPSGLTTIGHRAFYECNSLASIALPTGLETIGIEAFYYCSSLTSVTIPGSLTSTGQRAFQYSGLVSVTIQNGVETIESGSFYGCSKLASVTIPGSVTTIESVAFCNCSSLTSVTIPSSVTSIGVNAFLGCTRLASITVDAANTTLSSEDGVLFNKDKTFLIFYPAGYGASYTIPSSVTSIGDGAFRESNLTSITIPGRVTTIGNQAFSSTDLTSVTFGADSNIASGNFGPNAFPLYGQSDALRTLYLSQGTKAGTYRRASTSASEWTKD